MKDSTFDRDFAYTGTPEVSKDEAVVDGQQNFEERNERWAETNVHAAYDVLQESQSVEHSREHPEFTAQNNAIDTGSASLTTGFLLAALVTEMTKDFFVHSRERFEEWLTSDNEGVSETAEAEAEAGEDDGESAPDQAEEPQELEEESGEVEAEGSASTEAGTVLNEESELLAEQESNELGELEEAIAEAVDEDGVQDSSLEAEHEVEADREGLEGEFYGVDIASDSEAEAESDGGSLEEDVQSEAFEVNVETEVAAETDAYGAVAETSSSDSSTGSIDGDSGDGSGGDGGSGDGGGGGD